MESPLRTEVEKAVGALTKPREVLAALYPLAAKEVRYTGLEFGHSGILPYDCNQVWDRKYGDCKDKSTLLVSMLRSRGIEAWVGLVNTNSEGLIPKEVPGTRAFNHAIVIVDVDPGEKEDLVFCDPTISYGGPGIIAPATADRDVLLASSEGGRLVRSPAVTAGTYHYDFELEMDKAGRMSGWMNWKSTGYYAVSTASTYDGTDRESMRSSMARLVRNFFPDAEVIDVEVSDESKPGIKECVIKVFFTTEPGEQLAGANLPVNFPSSPTIFMNYREQKDRDSHYFQWQDAISVTMTLKIAKGLVPLVLHPPLHALSPGYHIDAKWGFESEKLTASLEVKCLKSSLNPEEVLAGQQASRAWARWSDQPLLLKAGEEWKEPTANTEIRLPLMPTGRGQLDLVQRWYPLGRESKRRELALKKVLQLFPGDPETRYETRLALAYIDYYADRMKEAVAAYEKLALKRPAGVSGENYSLAHYMVGLCAYEMKEFKKAEVSYQKSVAVEGASD